MSLPFSRRWLLRLVAATAILRPWSRLKAAASVGDPLGRLRTSLQHPEAFRRLGRQLLDRELMPRDRAALLRMLTGDGEAPDPSWDGPRWRAWCARRIREDFAHRRLCRLDGWVLARSEAALAALLALD